MRQRTRAAIGALIAAALLIAGSPAAADPQPPVGEVPPAPFTTWEQVFDAQNIRNNALDAIQAAAAAAGDVGYSSAIADPTGPLVLYWRGTPSAAVQQAITAQRAYTAITLASAPYTEAQLVAEAERISASSTRFAEVAPQENGSGLLVTWYAGQQDALVQSTTVSRAAVAVTFATETEPGPAEPMSRQNDDTPFSGGARTANCTTGFAANHVTGTKLLTAAHCGGVGSAVRDGAGDSMGTVGAVNTGRDVAYISVAAKGAMWDGGVQSNYAKQVQDVTSPRVGNRVCSSGSRSGVICGGRIMKVNVSFGGKSRLFRVENPNRTAFGGQGDSGGPVFSLGAPGKVRAVGLTVSGSTATRTSCVGEGGRNCYWRVYSADVRQTLALWNMSIRTQQS